MVIFSIQLTSNILVIWVSFGAYMNSTLLDEIPTKVRSRLVNNSEWGEYVGEVAPDLRLHGIKDVSRFIWQHTPIPVHLVLSNSLYHSV